MHNILDFVSSQSMNGRNGMFIRIARFSDDTSVHRAVLRHVTHSLGQPPDICMILNIRLWYFHFTRKGKKRCWGHCCRAYSDVVYHSALLWSPYV